MQYPMTKKDLPMTKKDAMEYLGIGRDVFNQELKAKRIKGALIGKRVLFYKDDLDAFEINAKKACQERIDQMLAPPVHMPKLYTPRKRTTIDDIREICKQHKTHTG